MAPPQLATVELLYFVIYYTFLKFCDCDEFIPNAFAREDFMN